MGQLLGGRLLALALLPARAPPPPPLRSRLLLLGSPLLWLQQRLQQWQQLLLQTPLPPSCWSTTAEWLCRCGSLCRQRPPLWLLLLRQLLQAQARAQAQPRPPAARQGMGALMQLQQLQPLPV
jgi:hypothetical protein